jgi:uncharacterized membrane protein
MLGPALISSAGVGPRRWRRLRPAVWSLAAGELFADKLPRLPNRTARGPLAARAVMGALVAVATRPRTGKRAALFAAVLGAAAAIAGAFAGFHLRRLASRRLGGGTIANAVTGALEDALIVKGGRSLARAG